MLCYRCGTHSPDTIEKCPTCGQNLATTGLRQATGTFSRRRSPTGAIEGAPYRAQDLVANRYLIKDVAGAGPLGFVFRAHDKEVDVEVALKVINPKLVQTADERKQFSKQLRLARKLSHPNLLRIYEEGEDAERPYFSAQFLDGLTLRKIIDLRLQKGQFFALHEIEPILAQVCAALDGAHKVGPHSDLKPENVLVLPDLLKVTDFGLGLAMPRLPFVQAMKARKAERYLAPEFIEGGEIDARADLYAVGVILGEMLSGLTPDGAVPELQRRNPSVTVGLEGLYRKAVHANPNARFKTASEFAQEFSALAKKAGPPPSTPEPRLEAAVGGATIARPRTATGMLQLQPRRERSTPELPPPPPPVTGEVPAPAVAEDPAPRAPDEAVAREAKKDREETEVLDSAKFISQLESEEQVETKALVDVVAAPPEPRGARGTSGSNTWLLVAALVLGGLGVGAGGGYVFLQRHKANPERKAEPARPTPPPPEDPVAAAEAKKAAEERALIEAIAADKVAKEKAGPARVEPEPAAAEKALADKAAADNALADKAAAERALADKAAADKAAAERALADKAAAERALADKAAADKAAAERALADKAAADKVAAEKAAADKALADKAIADKAAAAKAAADKAAAEKAALVAAAGTPKPAAAGCPDGMRLIAAGSFKMGTAPGDAMMGFDEKALTPVSLEAYCVDVFEHPNKRGVAPTASVGFADAKRLCEAQSKRLCSEAEWERACKGPGGAKWPYGGTFEVDACNNEDDVGDPRPVAVAGRFGRCRSGFGVADLAGNVAEWTSEKIIKGGSFVSSDYAVRCSARKNGASVSKSAEVGFRCCADAR